MNEILFKRQENKKYDKCIFRLDTSELQRRIKLILFDHFIIKDKTNEFSLLIHKKKIFVANNFG
jgi:hypothetical protein